VKLIYKREDGKWQRLNNVYHLNQEDRMIHRLYPLIILALMVHLSGCYVRFDPPSEAPCPIEGLVLTSEDLPGNSDDWFGEAPSIKGAPSTIGVERIGVVYATLGLFDGVLHHIYRLMDEKSAKKAYLDMEEEDFQLIDYLNEWELPAELSQLPLSADRHKIGCNIYSESGSKECRFLAQYGPYVVQFSIRLHGLEVNDVVRLIEEIDSRMTECLSPK